MKVRVEEPSQILRHVEVEIPADRVEEVFRESLADIKGKIRLKGFRKGKIPQNVLYKRFKSDIDSEVAAKLIDETFGKALEEHALRPVSTPQVDMDTIERGKPYRYTMSFEVLPEVDVDLGSIEEGLEVKVPKVVVTDESVEAKLDEMLLADAQLVEVQDRDVPQAGDFLMFDMEISVEGHEEPMVRKGIGLKFGEGLPDEFWRAVEATGKGETGTVEITLPQDDVLMLGYPGHRAEVRFTLEVIKEEQRPEKDDAWARDHDKETLDELREEIRAQLREAEETERDSLVETALLDELLERYEFEVPSSILQDEVSKRMQIFEMLAQDPSGGELKAKLGEIRADITVKAVKDLRRSILVAAIAKAKGIEVTEEDLEAKFKEIADRTGDPLPKVKAAHADRDRRSSLESELKYAAVMDYLKANATVVEVDEADVADDGAPDGGAGVSSDEGGDGEPEGADARSDEPEERADEA